MGFFSKAKKNGAWLAINVGSDGLRAVSVHSEAGARPQVTLSQFQAAASGAPALEKLGRELHAGRYRCTTLLRTGQYQLLTLDAPNVAADELKTAVRWRLKDMLDFHIDDATVDVLDIPLDKNAPTRAHTMFAVCARNQVVRERQELFDAARVPLRAIDIPEMAQRNIAALAEPEGRGLALLAFDEDGGLLTVSQGGELFLARRLDVTPAQLGVADSDARLAAFDRVALELQRSLDHFDRQFHHVTLSKLLLAPLGEAGGSLESYLASNLYIPVEQFDLASVFDFSKTPELQDTELQRQYFLTLGAALRVEEAVL